MKITIEHYDIKTSWETDDEAVLDDVMDAFKGLLGIIGYQTDNLNEEDNDEL